jgi:hypothetical protein
MSRTTINYWMPLTKMRLTATTTTTAGSATRFAAIVTGASALARFHETGLDSPRDPARETYESSDDERVLAAYKARTRTSPRYAALIFGTADARVRDFFDQTDASSPSSGTRSRPRAYRPTLQVPTCTPRGSGRLRQARSGAHHRQGPPVQVRTDA